jgi:hypothetical protein
LPPPPPAWGKRFEALADECRLAKAMEIVFDGVRAYVEAVLPPSSQK